jgi:hypothetical protein
MCGYRRLDAAIARYGSDVVEIVDWRATVDEDGHYSFAVLL